MIDKEIIKLAKSMKRDFVVIRNNYMMGTDVYRCTLSIIYEGSPECFSGAVGELEGKNPPDYYIGPQRIEEELDGLMKRTFNALENRLPSFSIDNMKDDDSFINVLNRKMADGADVYIFNTGYPMSIFSSLHPLNKSDKIKCEIYDINDGTYIAHFIIYKPKYQIHEYIRYLYL